MIDVTIKFLGAIRNDMGMSSTTLTLPPGTNLRDLEPQWRQLGIDPEAADIVITLNGRGLRQWPPDRCFAVGDTIAVFPLISGGQLQVSAHRFARCGKRAHIGSLTTDLNAGSG